MTCMPNSSAVLIAFCNPALELKHFFSLNRDLDDPPVPAPGGVRVLLRAALLHGGALVNDNAETMVVLGITADVRIRDMAACNSA